MFTAFFQVAHFFQFKILSQMTDQPSFSRKTFKKMSNL